MIGSEAEKAEVVSLLCLCSGLKEVDALSVPSLKHVVIFVVFLMHLQVIRVFLATGMLSPTCFAGNEEICWLIFVFFPLVEA